MLRQLIAKVGYICECATLQRTKTERTMNEGISGPLLQQKVWSTGKNKWQQLEQFLALMGGDTRKRSKTHKALPCVVLCLLFKSWWPVSTISNSNTTHQPSQISILISSKYLERHTYKAKFSVAKAFMSIQCGTHWLHQQKGHSQRG